jgi:hypothetical protein
VLSQSYQRLYIEHFTTGTLIVIYT